MKITNAVHVIMRPHGPLTRYVKLQVAHAPGMPGTFSPAADFKGNRKLAIPVCITARAWRTCRDACRDRSPAVTGKMFPAFPAHAHPQFCVSGKRPIMITRLIGIFIAITNDAICSRIFKDFIISRWRWRKLMLLATTIVTRNLVPQ